MECRRCGLPILDFEDAYRYRLFGGPGRAADEEVTAEADGEHVACVEAGKQGQRIRIVCERGDFTWARALLVQPDGTEVPIRDIVRSCTVKIEEGQLNIATVVFEGVEVDISGYVDPASEPVH